MLPLTLCSIQTPMGTCRSKHSRSVVPVFCAIVRHRHGREDISAVESLLPGRDSDRMSRELDCVAFDKKCCGHSKNSMGK